MTQGQKTDELIAEAVQKGDIQSFGVLVERFEPRMLRYARRFLLGSEDAQDLVQEVFMKAFVNLQSFDSSRNFSAWLYRIAHNEFINAIKKKGREPLSFFDPDTLFPHPAAEGNAQSLLAEHELKQMLDQCLNELDPKYREPLVLYYYEDMDYNQISEIMHVPASTVGIRLKRGKVALQKVYSKLNPHP